MKRYTTIDKIEHCARCGKTHLNLKFKKLRRKPGPFTRYTHWGTCPTNKEPIMMRVTEDKKVKP